MIQKLSCFNSAIIAFLIFVIPLTAQPQKSFQAKNGMVVAAEEIAAKVGLQILKKGGNSVDAAAAIGFALAVTYPVAGNIGGGGFLIAHLNEGKNIAIDFREKAPLASKSDMYLDSLGNFIQEKSLIGGLAVGVPGTVAGLLYALEKYGTKSIEEIIQPAINLAEYGFPLSHSNAESLNSYKKSFIKFESTKKLFTKHGSDYEAGEILIQKDLAKSLERIKVNGVKGFYEGYTADKIVESVTMHEGIITHQDLLNYKPVERDVIKGKFKGYDIISMPPPSSGGVALIQMLNILENFSFTTEDFGSSRYLHTLIESMKFAYVDRAFHLGDPDYYNVPVNKLISKDYAKELAQMISDNAIPSSAIKSGVMNSTNESEQTTHYSVYDKYGNAVSVTYTLNSGYGSKLVADGTGIFLNNEMDDLSAKPNTPNQFGLVGSAANAIEPGKRMLSSMTPTIVLKNGKPFIIVGSPGGSTIITVVLQVILNSLVFQMNLEDAVNAPRIHHQWLPDLVIIEKYGTPNDVLENLKAKGFQFGSYRKLGLVEAILIDQDSNVLFGVSDKRGFGSAEGY